MEERNLRNPPFLLGLEINSCTKHHMTGEKTYTKRKKLSRYKI